MGAARVQAGVVRDDGPSIFDPIFVASFGSVLFTTEAKFRKRFETREPLNAPAFLQTIAKIDKADPLGCEAYYNLRNTLRPEQRTVLMQATARRMLAHDHVEEVCSPDDSGVLAMYIARGRPDKWRPWSKSDHRRVPKPGVWVTPKPANSSAKAFWDARRKIGLLEAVDNDAGECTCYFFPDPVVHGHEDELGDPEAVGGEASLDLTSATRWPRARRCVARRSTHAAAAPRPDPAAQRAPRQGGQPQLWPLGDPQVDLRRAAHRRVIFGIVDARRGDERFWCGAADVPRAARRERGAARLTSVCLCQLAHSYLGMKHKTDVLDMANDFLFTGMAVIRNQSYGMTSCGTGGIWAITSGHKAGEFFYGRTMIEDTSSSHEKFLEGRRSVYLAPFRAGKQLMRAVPQGAANYLDALEQDTGAVQRHRAGGAASGSTSPTSATCCCCSRCWGRRSSRTTSRWASSSSRRWSTSRTRSSRDHRRHAHDALPLDDPPLRPLAAHAQQHAALPHPLFNSIYPFNTVASVFWIAIPPWLCFTASFPFNLDAVTAIIGSMILKIVEAPPPPPEPRRPRRCRAHLARSPPAPPRPPTRPGPRLRSSP